MSTFVISKRFDETYKFEFQSRKGKTIFTSNSFELRFECENEIEFLKLNLESILFLKSKSSSGKFFFRMIVLEKEVAVSRKYATQLMLEKGIQDVLKYGLKAEILNFAEVDFDF